MKKRNQKRRIPVFYIVYLSVLAAVILLIIVSLGILSSRLAEYEAVQPKHIAGEVFDRYFSPSVDYSALLSDAVYDSGTSTVAEITEHLKNEIGNKEITYSLGSSSDDDTITYIVKAGNIKFAAINLQTSPDVVTEHGYKTYEFVSLELYITTENTSPTEPIPTYTVTVNAPSGYSVSLDGSVLTEAYIKETFLNDKALSHFPSDVSGVEYVTYTVSQLENIPTTFSATDENGNIAEYDYDEEACIYTVKVNYDDELSQQYSELVTDTITGYAAFMQADSKLKNIKNYFDTSSALYESIEAASKDLWMVKDHSGYDFTDIKTGEFFRLSDTSFVCRISFTHVLHMENKTDRPDVIDMYVFLHLTDGEYKIYEWYNNT